jgi:NhaP-type Na+/H+ or K+/H+ antiporter
MLKTFFFIYLGISMQFGEWTIFAWSAGAVAAVYVLRAVVVRFAVPPSVSRPEAAVMSVMAPKGLAAAVLAGVPAQMGIAEGPAIQQFVYAVVLVSIVFTSVAVPLIPLGPVRALSGWLFPRQQAA